MNVLEYKQDNFWRSQPGVVLIGFLVVAGFFLITGQTAHLLGALP